MTVVSLAEVKAYLNITSSDSDAELMSFLGRAEAGITRRARQITPTSATFRCEGGGCRGLVLPTAMPVVSVQSVTPVGSAPLVLSDLYINAAAGVIEYNLGGTFNSRAYDVAYTAGYAVTPEDIKAAILELVRHLWGTQRPGGGRFSSGGAESAANTLPGAAYIYNFRVEQLLAPFKRTAVA